MKYGRPVWDIEPIIKTDYSDSSVFQGPEIHKGPLRYLLLKINCPRIYMKVDRQTSFRITYEGMFCDRFSLNKYIEEKELGAEYTEQQGVSGISVLTIGDNPDYYAILDLFRLPPDVPQLIGRVSTFM